MDQLLADVLVVVMSYLGVEDVLACRLVCKRFADVALHPDVWQHRFIIIRSECRCACPVLRLAPRVDKLRLTLGDTSPCHQPLPSACAVRELQLVVTGPKGAQQAVQLLGQQEGHGHLRAVSLESILLSTDTDDATAMLFRTLASTSGLEHLTVSDGFAGLKTPESTVPNRGSVAPSLKTFFCPFTPQTACFCRYVLSAHAATLEELYFPIIKECVYPSRNPAEPLPVPDDLIAGMPRLRKLARPQDYLTHYGPMRETARIHGAPAQRYHVEEPPTGIDARTLLQIMDCLARGVAAPDHLRHRLFAKEPVSKPSG